ncbi:DoxX-like family protein [Hyunsoonleella jejuensis]|uniref:DoxX-like family protein n=1 Tax=Hyunsoonleella jejuensis TaxID=419940 RepID=A0A1H9KGG3_9FLAO|nr:DoxX family protein [Hyunsoonleella jejuensis]SEQ98244.1 DoxX-like family protein [Hyunsoonleella jejuensis]
MKKHIPLVLRVILAVILIQTLRFKFLAHPDSVFIFETVGLEPYGRIGIGIVELVAGILLLVKKTAWAGALLSLGVIGGALIMHLTKLGIDVKGDDGLLFGTAVFAFLLSVIITYNYREDIPFLKL